MPADLGVLVLLAPALLIAVVAHPKLNGNWLTDTAWAWALYVEAVAVLPQLLMFSRGRDKEVEPLTANSLFCLAVARACFFVFWLSSHAELNDRYSASFHRKFPGLAVVLSQIVNLLVRWGGVGGGFGGTPRLALTPLPPTPHTHS